jgi:hypothetical protein
MFFFCFRYQARQDHLMRAHFMDKLEAAFPDMKTKHCPLPACDYVAKDKQVFVFLPSLS